MASDGERERAARRAPELARDVVHALALVTDVARERPGMAIDWVAEPAFAELPAMSPHVAQRHSPLRGWRRAPFGQQTWRAIGAFRHALRAQYYDAILDLQEQVKGALVASTPAARRMDSIEPAFANRSPRGSTTCTIASRANCTSPRVAECSGCGARLRTERSAALVTRASTARRGDARPR